ncbi:MAG: DGQHR domain-containing protein [Lachnospiraceae bacterium]|nr:DGQHR domain-containing protein [Lachnospiraceae bacterium]
MPKVSHTQWEMLVENGELESEAKIRAKECLEESVKNSEVQDYLDKGWIIKKEGKTKTLVQKEKNIGNSFEDKVWSVIYKMGFSTMNKGNDFAIVYDQERSLSKQIDVIAMDDETCLFIECKETAEEGNKKDWRLELTEIHGLFQSLCNAIREHYPDKKFKFKYIFATKNYIIGDTDKDRMDSFGIYNFDDKTVLYYDKLGSYLGKAARYQLLGALFKGKKIDELDTRIPAIRGFMGNLTYYTFLIEPEKLLKIGYVLHRTNANNDYEDMLPSYQRLIKKERLKKIREFVEGGGYFPNSIIISVDSKNGMRFDPIGKEGGNNPNAKMGILYIPQIYQTAYIIDGQHRLYGYSDTKYAINNTIPVVAFDNLDKDVQLQLFMEINENQKAVSKALRNILEIEMNLDSPDPDKSQKAWLGFIAKRLGEDDKSPLFGRVVIGEDAETKKCCITIEYIKSALGKSGLFNKYGKKGVVIEQGLLDKGDNKKTADTVYFLLVLYLNQIKDEYLSEWVKGGDGYLTRNNTMVALIRIFGDIVGIVLENNPGLSEKDGQVIAEISKYTLALSSVLRDLPAEERDEINSIKGGQAQERPYRILQMAFHNAYPDFTNSDIEEYYTNFYIDYKADTSNEMSEVRTYFISFLKSLFPEDELATKHMDDSDGRNFNQRIQNKIFMNKKNGNDEKVDIWDELTLADISKIMGFGSQWSTYFKDKFSSLGIKGTRLEVLSDFDAMNKIKAKIESGKKVTLKEYQLVHSFYQPISEELDGTNN